jgi:Molybdopterin-binding domain of aldehyde dehydrogenase
MILAGSGKRGNCRSERFWLWPAPEIIHELLGEISSSAELWRIEARYHHHLSPLGQRRVRLHVGSRPAAADQSSPNAETEWAAVKASRQLKASWSAWEGLPDQNQLWEHVRATRISKQEINNIGDATAALDTGATRLKATYDFTIHTHGSIGPSCAIAEVKDGKLTCWTASQATHNLRKQLAAMLAMPVEAVRAIYVEGSGCYGRNGHEDAAADAALR